MTIDMKMKERKKGRTSFSLRLKAARGIQSEATCLSFLHPLSLRNHNPSTWISLPGYIDRQLNPGKGTATRAKARFFFLVIWSHCPPVFNSGLNQEELVFGIPHDQGPDRSSNSYVFVCFHKKIPTN